VVRHDKLAHGPTGLARDERVSQAQPPVAQRLVTTIGEGRLSGECVCVCVCVCVPTELVKNEVRKSSDEEDALHDILRLQLLDQRCFMYRKVPPVRRCCDLNKVHNAVRS
jgi:hypothetical protein